MKDNDKNKKLELFDEGSNLLPKPTQELLELMKKLITKPSGKY
jgi:hypothetical protein